MVILFSAGIILPRLLYTTHSKGCKTYPNRPVSDLNRSTIYRVKRLSIHQK